MPQQHPDALEHVDRTGTYALVFAALIVLTIATTAVAFVDLGPFSVVVALVIAACKMLLVALFFMHVRHSGPLTRLVLVGALLWLGILIFFTLADFATRGWLGVAGR
jgi:cytochrome c oxidase subunit 4